MNFIKGWYVIYTKSHYEKKVTQKLIEENSKVYLPVITVISQWSNRKKKTENPLFNSYVFVYLETLKNYFRSLSIDGVVLFIKFDGRLVRVLNKKNDRINNMWPF